MPRRTHPDRRRAKRRAAVAAARAAQKATAGRKTRWTPHPHSPQHQPTPEENTPA